MTAAQLDANEYIVRTLVDKYPSITILEGHLEYLEMKDSPYWLELDPDYHTSKIDPGPIFMADVRKRVADLKLKSPGDFSAAAAVLNNPTNRASDIDKLKEEFVNAQ